MIAFVLELFTIAVLIGSGIVIAVLLLPHRFSVRGLLITMTLVAIVLGIAFYFGRGSVH